LTRFVLGLGANLGARAATIRTALAWLDARPAIVVGARSSFYETPALTLPGREPGPPFLNAAAWLETGLAPEALLDELLATERSLGRVREVRWGDRTIDLDLLWSPDVTVRGERLEVPHPRLAGRDFALAPLLEIAPEAPWELAASPARWTAPEVILRDGGWAASGALVDALAGILEAVAVGGEASEIAEVRATLPQLPSALGTCWPWSAATVLEGSRGSEVRVAALRVRGDAAFRLERISAETHESLVWAGPE